MPEISRNELRRLVVKAYRLGAANGAVAAEPTDEQQYELLDETINQRKTVVVSSFVYYKMLEKARQEGKLLDNMCIHLGIRLEVKDAGPIKAKCLICRKRFKSRKGVREHIQARHPNATANFNIEVIE